MELLLQKLVEEIGRRIGSMLAEKEFSPDQDGSLIMLFILSGYEGLVGYFHGNMNLLHFGLRKSNEGYVHTSLTSR